jgi:hypothetical protein
MTKWDSTKVVPVDDIPTLHIDLKLVFSQNKLPITPMGHVMIDLGNKLMPKNFGGFELKSYDDLTK